MTIAKDILILIQADPRLGALVRACDERGDQGAFVALQKVAGADFKSLLEQLVAPRDWYVSREDDRPSSTLQLFVEARVHPPITPPAVLYHASRTANRKAIEVDGLKLHAQGSTWMRRTYDPPRVHFARSHADALAFIESAVTGTSAPQGLTEAGKAELPSWDLWTLSPGDEPYFVDVEMNTAVWTTAPIPADRLTRIDPGAGAPEATGP